MIKKKLRYLRSFFYDFKIRLMVWWLSESGG